MSFKDSYRKFKGNIILAYVHQCPLKILIESFKGNNILAYVHQCPFKDSYRKFKGNNILAYVHQCPLKIVIKCLRVIIYWHMCISVH